MTHGIKGATGVGRTKWWLLGALQLICVATAGATSDDDYRRGFQAYQSGDVVTAMSLLRAPAGAGHAAAQSLLAFILDRADLVEDAVRWYRAAAAQDDPEAYAALANFYLTGRGIAKDEKQALQHFSKAAELGHASAIEVVAEAYLKGQLGLTQTTRDNAAAVVALRRAAERRHLPSVQALAAAYRDGGFGLTPDTTQAARWQAVDAEMRAARGGAAKKARP